MIKSFLEEEAQGFIFKICLSIICVSVLVFSLFQLGYAFQAWVLQFDDAFKITVLVFTSTLLFSLIGLLFVFRKRREKVKVELENPLHPFMGMSLQEKGFVFMRGLLDGLVNGRH
ncbi:MAG: hypothetical protein JNL11_05800 [Bdellovibrionaceae bacterium]|nr:hypothetical protein [Pseudobdellovibrionaceae bacterium]